MLKTNLIIDASFFFRRSLSATDFSNYLVNKEKVLDSKKTQAIFVRKVAMDFAFQIKKFSDLNISRVVLCTDSDSWRKKYYREYKATRTKEDIVNWTVFYKLCDDILKYLKERNCTVTNVKGLEGDDLIYFYSMLFKKSDNINIIISSDKDLKQLVNHNTIVHNVITNKSTIQHNFKIEGTEDKNVNILDMDDNSFILNKTIGQIKSLLQDAEVIDGFNILFSKIVLGDKSDNIPNLIPSFGQKKVENIITKYSNKIFNTEYFLNLNGDTDDGCMDLFDMMKEEKKTIEYNEELALKIRQNLTLTWLNTSVIPKEHTIGFKNWIIDNKDALNKKSTISRLSSMYDILEGTDYVSSNDYENDDSIFNPINFDDLS